MKDLLPGRWVNFGRRFPQKWVNFARRSTHRALGKRFDTEESALILLDRFLFMHGVRELSGITPDLMDAFLASRPRGRPRSYNHLVGVLQRLFRWLVVQEVLSSSPVRARPRRVGRQHHERERRP